MFFSDITMFFLFNTWCNLHPSQKTGVIQYLEENQILNLKIKHQDELEREK